MKIQNIILIILALLFLNSCNMVKVNDDWPPNCCGPEQIVPPGNAERFTEGINTKADEIAPVQRPEYIFDDYSSLDFADPCYRESATERQDDFDGVRSSRYFFEMIASKNKITDAGFLGYLTDNVESITFTQKNAGFIALSHPPSKVYADMMNFKAEGVIGGTDIFQFELEDGDEFRFKNVSPISELNTPFWESHTFATTKRIDGIVHTLLLWASDSANPYSKVVFNRKDIEKRDSIKGSTDIYYSFFNGESWSGPKLLEVDNVNLPNIYEGTPFIYCLCNEKTEAKSASYLLFSSNREDKTPNLVEKGMVEDFDIYHVLVNIDFKNQTIKLAPNEIVKMYEKKKTDTISAADARADYFAINTEFDDRFPYVPNPTNKDEKFLYFSSNRNMEPTKIKGIKDSVLKGKGQYDIYRHNIDMACSEIKIEPIRLVVDVLDAETNEKIPETIVTLYFDGKPLRTIEGQNPAIFDSLQFDKIYQVKGGSKYSDGEPTVCNSLLTEYFAPYGQNYDITRFDTIKITSKKLIPIDSIAIYDNGFMLSTKSKTKYHNFLKYEGKRDTFIRSKKTNNENDKQTVEEVKRVERNGKIYYYQDVETLYFDSFSDEIYKTNTGDNLQVNYNFDEVKAGKINSEYSYNGGFYTFNLSGGETIKDKIYLAKQTDTVRCIDLMVNIETVCNSEIAVKSPCIRIDEYDEVNDKWIDVTHTIDIKDANFYKTQYVFGLVYGKKYKVYGGSDFTDTLSCNELVFYTPADFKTENECYAEYTYQNELDKIPVAGCNVLSELTKAGEIDTKKYTEPMIYDKILLKEVHFNKPPCNYSFTEVFTEMRRRVPYFQTAFWEVNTRENLRNFWDNVENRSAFYWRNYEIPEEAKGDLKNTTWPGAKWIELHPENSYWGRYDSTTKNRRSDRIAQYNTFASRVDANLEQMRKMINDSLLKVYEYINGRPNCAECESKKFVIEVEAWSDYRPVKYGWYLSPGDSNDVIQYAECADILGFNDKADPKDFFKYVKVKENDPLGENNKNLSILRAYFGYQTLFNILMKDLSEDNRFRNYDGKILLPHHLIDKTSGKLKSIDEINRLIKQSKIIILAKGYDTYVPEPNSPDYTKIDDPVEVEKYKKLKSMSNYYNLDTIRTLQVKIRQLEYKDIMRQDECCEPSELYEDGSMLFRKEDIIDDRRILR